MKNKIQIKSMSGDILFECECNTVKEAVVEAVKSDANLSWADLHGANLRGADLHGADLHCAYLHGADLHCAYLHCADLRGADMGGANLRGAYLRGADLRGADLRGADMGGANLYRADLRGANLRGADLRGAKNIPELQLSETIIVPEGDIIGWKKCNDNIIVKLLIPKEARRSNATGRKCRAEYVEVLELIDGNDKRRKVDVGISQRDGKTEYRKGETVKCDKWNEDRLRECAGGIHFFITRIEAENYI